MVELDSLDFRADLMSGDIVAGHIRARHVEPVCPELLPLCFQRGGDVADWLEHRAIDAHGAIQIYGISRYLHGVWRVHPQAVPALKAHASRAFKFKCERHAQRGLGIQKQAVL